MILINICKESDMILAKRKRCELCVREERRGEKHKIDKRQYEVLKKKKEMYINK